MTRDVDLFRRCRRLRVNVTVTTGADEVRRRYEPHCPSNAARFKALKALSAAGVRIGVSISPMLPIDDVESFGKRLADLNAEEYVTQYLKPGRSRFAAGTGIEAARKASEDGWTVRACRRARSVRPKVRANQRTRLGGGEGDVPWRSVPVRRAHRVAPLDGVRMRLHHVAVGVDNTMLRHGFSSGASDR